MNRFNGLEMLSGLLSGWKPVSAAYLVACGLLLGGCRAATPTTPTAVEVTGLRQVSITAPCGYDDPPSNATVTVNGTLAQLDYNGAARFPTDVTGQVVDIEAPGFLHRRTVASTLPISLWPAEDGDEEVLRTLVFEEIHGETRLRAVPASVEVDFGASITPSLRADALLAAGLLNGIMQQTRVGFPGGPPVTPAADVVTRLEIGPCPPSPFGICRVGGSDALVHITLDASRRPETMTRVLAMLFLRGDNPQPGLVSSSRPTSTLSPVEINALCMVHRRSTQTRVPDDDSGR